jgi:hypothetical protein
MKKNPVVKASPVFPDSAADDGLTANEIAAAPAKSASKPRITAKMPRTFEFTVIFGLVMEILMQRTVCLEIPCDR